MYILYTLQDFQAQWELVVSLLYQHAMDYLFCQSSLSLEVVGGISGDFDIGQFAVDYQPSHSEVIDKEVSTVHISEATTTYI